jgi:hypothetical protein
MKAKSPVLIRFPTFNELILKLFKIDFIFLLFILYFLTLFLSLFFLLVWAFILLFTLLNFLFSWINFHSVDYVIIYNPNIILVICSNRFCSICPIRLVVFLSWYILLLTFYLIFNHNNGNLLLFLFNFQLFVLLFY